MSWLDDAGSIAGPIMASLLWAAWGVGALMAFRIGLAIFTEIYAVVLLHRVRRFPLTRKARRT